eukprot:12913951-Prorocentrum_lima.AAC.1
MAPSVCLASVTRRSRASGGCTCGLSKHRTGPVCCLWTVKRRPCCSISGKQASREATKSREAA